MTLWRWTALVSFAFLTISLSFGRIAGMAACHVVPEPILAFELVRSPAEVAGLFPEACRAVHAAAQRSGLWLDILGFVPVYSAFLILGLFALRRESAAGVRWAKWGIAAVVIAALSDQWENSRLLALLARMPGDQALIDQLWPAPRIKFALLGLVVALSGALHAAAGGWRRLAGGAVLFAGLASGIGVAVNPSLMMGAGTLGWLGLVGLSWVRAVVPVRAAPV